MTAETHWGRPSWKDSVSRCPEMRLGRAQVCWMKGQREKAGVVGSRGANYKEPDWPTRVRVSILR